MATESNDGPPLTELESLQLKANNITDESLESTRRMIALCEDSKEAGIKTLVALDDQGEQLNRIEKGMDDMNEEMIEAEKHLKGMEKWCGLCICPFWKRSKVRDSDAQWSKSQSSSSATKTKVPAASNKEGANHGPYVKRILNDAREDEMEENMQAVGGILGNLKTMAQDMSGELEQHNKQIDRINIKASSVDTRIGSANQRTDKLLK